MFGNQTLPYGQEWFTKRMQSLRSSSITEENIFGDPEGVCQGFAHIFMHAHFLKDIGSFNDRLFVINEIDEKNFVNLIEEVTKKRIALLQNAKNAAQNLLISKYGLSASLQNSPPFEATLDETQKEEFHRETNRILETSEQLELTEREKIILTILPFLVGIELYFQANFHPDFFPKENPPYLQEVAPALELLLPEALRQQGGIANVNSFSSCYTPDELIAYFSNLRESTKENENSTFSLVLSSARHAINVSYDKDNDVWIFMDPNRLPAIFVKDNAEIANLVSTSQTFSANGMTAFATDMYVMKKDYQLMHNFMQHLDNQEEWNRIHSITLEKATWKNSDDSFWLYIAAKHGHADIVKKLLDIYPENLNELFRNNSPLYIAACKGQIAAIKELLSRKGIDMHTVLFEGVKSRLGGLIVKALLDSGISPNIYHNDQSLFNACLKANNSNALQILMAHPDFDFSELEKINNPSIFHINKNPKIIRSLIEKGLDPNRKDSQGNTLLHITANMGDAMLTKLLLEYNANPIVLNNLVMSPLDVALKNENLAVIKILLESNKFKIDIHSLFFDAVKNNKINLVETLLSLNNSLIDINHIKDGATALCIAAEKGFKEMATLLLQNHADPDATYPIHIAILRDNNDIVSILLKNGSNPNLPDQDKETPLHLAAGKRNLAVVKSLIDHGFTAFNIQNEKGQTPFQSITKPKLGDGRKIATLLTEAEKKLSQRSTTEEIISPVQEAKNISNLGIFGTQAQARPNVTTQAKANQSNDSGKDKEEVLPKYTKT